MIAFGLTQVTVGARTRVPASWTFDLDAIERAARELGAVERITVGYAEYRRGRWQGMHAWDRRARRHTINVARWLSPEQASRTVWHELTHAAQAERGECDTNGTTQVRREQGRDAYLQDPREVEARANECNHERLALVRAGA